MNNTVKLMRDTPRRREQPPLRCRPGDLAMVTRLIDHYGRDRNILGLMFRVVALVPSPFRQPVLDLRRTAEGDDVRREHLAHRLGGRCLLVAAAGQC